MIAKFTLTLEDFVENARLHRSGVREILARVACAIFGTLIFASLILTWNPALSRGARLFGAAVGAAAVAFANPACMVLRTVEPRPRTEKPGRICASDEA